jgi:hypothetical protein
VLKERYLTLPGRGPTGKPNPVAERNAEKALVLSKYPALKPKIDPLDANQWKEIQAEAKK